MAEKKNNDIQIFARNKKEVLLRSLNKYSLKNCLKNSEYSINLTYFFSESNTQESLVSSIRGLRSRGLFEAAKASLKGFFLPGINAAQTVEELAKILLSQVIQDFTEDGIVSSQNQKSEGLGQAISITAQSQKTIQDATLPWLQLYKFMRFILITKIDLKFYYVVIKGLNKSHINKYKCPETNGTKLFLYFLEPTLQREASKINLDQGGKKHIIIKTRLLASKQ